ncbi:MAG TPA: Gfo/Idh/MocA family oxidoreductase, partial [Planctomycetota bacterium]|nr:Gfo/Idh/MocA family oxidoreductase [Planctomycetota bacterium]
MRPRIALVGARRARQGLGPFVARFLEAAGADVVGFLGTGPASLPATGEALASVLGHSVAGFHGLDALLAETTPDALAILCPPEHHREYLEAACERGLHVLCEKPLVMQGRDAWGAVPGLLERFEQRGLLLAENCQWPWVLPAFWSLFPEGSAEPIERFAMGLSPTGVGVQMAIDSLSHPLSLLQALLPGPARVEAIRVQGQAPSGPQTVEFAWERPQGSVACRVELVDSPERPRPAWIEINGRRADRRIREHDYALFFEGGDGLVPVPDPLRLHLGAFVHTLGAVLEGDPPPDLAAVRLRAALLHQLLQA